MTSSLVWQAMTGSAKDIGVGKDGDAWIIGQNDSVYQWTGSAWSEIEATGRALAVTPNGVLWTVGLDGWVYRCDKHEWTQFVPPIPCKDIGVDSAGQVWLVSDDNQIFKQAGDTFERFDGSALRISAGPNNRPWIVGTDQRIWSHNGQNWITFPPLVNCRDIAVGADGSVWAIDDKQRVLHLDVNAGTWTPTDVLATRLAVSTNGMVWAVRLDGTIVRQKQVAVSLTARDSVADAVWQLTGGLGNDIAVGPEGSVWVVGTDWKAWRYSGQGWSSVNCVARRIAVAANDTPWVIGSNYDIWQRSGDIWALVFAVPNGAHDLAVGPSGAVYVATTTQAIYCWKNNTLTQIPGAANQVAVDGNDDLWVANAQGIVFRYAGGIWQQFDPPGGGAKDIAASLDGSIWIVGKDDRVYRLNNERTGWIATSQTGAMNVSVGPDGTVWVTQNDTRLFRTKYSRRASSGRDFMMGLFWRYVGRAPNPLELDYHFERLLNRSMTRLSLEAEFAACPEAKIHRAFADRDFVNYLAWRYLGRDAGTPGLDYHFNRLLNATTTRDALENEFRTCPEAQAYGQTKLPHYVNSVYYRYLGRLPSAAELTRDTAVVRTFDAIDTDLRTRQEGKEHAHLLYRDFVAYLCWRYFGHDPGGDYHFQRLVNATTTQKALEAEFSTCTEASEYLPTHAPLIILGAAYTGAKPGREDVTARIRSWVAENQLLAGWRPVDLDSNDNGDRQVLVIVYRYGDGPARMRTFPTGTILEIQPGDGDRANSLGTMPKVRPEALTILGAAYGRKDVTNAARGKASQDRLYADASDAEWGADGPFGTTKALVVIYQVGSGPPIVSVTPNSRRAFVNAPPLQILGATFGPVDITAALAAQVRGGALEVYVDWHVYGSDPWPGVWKSVVVVYRYGDESQPIQVIAQREQNMLTITPPAGLPEGTEQPQYGLRILGAAYGMNNVTNAARDRVRNDIWDVLADNATWGEGWYGNAKSLTVVYQIDGGRPLLRTAKNGEKITIAAPRIFGAAWGTLDVTDRIATMIRGGTFSFVPTRELLGNHTPSQTLTLTVVYDHGDNAPRIATGSEQVPFTLPISALAEALPKTTGVQILAATMGSWNVTSQVRRSQRNFLQSLCARYLNRRSSGPEFDFHLGRLIRGEISQSSLETEFSTCVEAQHVGPVTNNAFVTSLYLRYLGREPDPGGLAFHVARVTDPTNPQAITREALEDEFGKCPEAINYTATQTIVADNSLLVGQDVPASWLNAPKTLTVVYRFASGPPRVLVAMQGETLVVRNEEPSIAIGRPRSAHVIAEVRAVQDFVVNPPIVNVTAAGVVIPLGDPSVVMPAPSDVAAQIKGLGVNQVVVMPRTVNGELIPEGTRLTVVCGEPIDLLSDQSGRMTIYRLTPHVPIEIVVPTSGRCRFAIAVGENLVTPLVRVRWSQMPADVWAILALDQHLQSTLANLQPENWLNPGEGKTSPISRYEVGRAYALQTALSQAFAACDSTEIRARSSDGALRVVRPFDVGMVDVPKKTEFVIPQHAQLHGNLVLSRALITGATSLYAQRRASKYRAMGFFDDLWDTISSGVGSIGHAFESGFDAVSSALTAAFNATLGGLETAFRGTVESMQSLVTVADKLATTVGSFTAATYENAQCVLMDATNGLVAFAISIRNGVIEVTRTVLTTLEDIALLVADTLRRVALQVKQMVEFILMFLFMNWRDILETQVYLANAVNAELDALPTFADTMADQVKGVFADVITTLGLDASGAASMSMTNPSSTVTSTLGNAFGFIFDRVESAFGFFGSNMPPAPPAFATAMDHLHAALAPLTSQMGLIDITNLAQLADFKAVLSVLKQLARNILIAVRDGVTVVLEALKQAAPLVKQALNERLYIPVLTELIEVFIFQGKSDLTILSLVTLMSGAALNNIYKLTTFSTRGPFHDEPQGHAVLSATQFNMANTTLVTTDSTTPLASKKATPTPTQSTGRTDSGDKKLAVGFSLTAGVASLVGFGARGLSKNPRSGPSLSVLSSMCGLIATSVNTPAFGRWWPAELTVGMISMTRAVLEYEEVVRPPGMKDARRLLGAMQIPPAIAGGIGEGVDQVQPLYRISLRMSASTFGGLADFFDTPGTQKDRLYSLLVAWACRLGLGIEAIATL